MKTVFAIMDRVLVLASALLFVQIPQFIQIYFHIMTGHLAEIRQQLNILKNYALSTGKTLPELIQKFLANGDSDIQFQGKVLEGLLTRELRFQEAIEAMQTAGPFMKPIYFFRYFHAPIADEAYTNFVFGLPVTFESLYYAVAGIGFGILLVKILSFLFYLPLSRTGSAVRGKR